jgi:malate synthase
MFVPPVEQVDRVLTPTATAFVQDLTRRFRPRIEELLARRRTVQQKIDAGQPLDFLVDTADDILMKTS